MIPNRQFEYEHAAPEAEKKFKKEFKRMDKSRAVPFGFNVRKQFCNVLFTSTDTACKCYQPKENYH